MRLLGIVLIVIGLLLIIYGGVTLMIPSDRTDMGPFSITVKENVVIPLPPIAGAAFLIVGVVLLASAPVYGPPPPY